MFCLGFEPGTQAGWRWRFYSAITVSSHYWSNNGHLLASFFFIYVFSTQLKEKEWLIKVCRWLDSNHGSLVSEMTSLPTEAQPLPKSLLLLATLKLKCCLVNNCPTEIFCIILRLLLLILILLLLLAKDTVDDVVAALLLLLLLLPLSIKWPTPLLLGSVQSLLLRLLQLRKKVLPRFLVTESWISDFFSNLVPTLIKKRKYWIVKLVVKNGPTRPLFHLFLSIQTNNSDNK